LDGAARELWGLDIDEAGVRVLSSRGFARVHCGSAEDPPTTIPRSYFDVIVAGEIIEHVRNVGLFLDAAASLLRPGGRLIVTTPNALRFYNPVPAVMGFELVHPDHLAWFSPHTLAQAIERAPPSVGAVHTYRKTPLLRVERTMTPLQRIRRRTANLFISFTHRIATRMSSHLGDGIIVSARLAEAQTHKTDPVHERMSLHS